MRTGIIILAELFLFAASAQAFAEAMTDDAIRRILIQESIARYSGNCPCPDNLANNGSRCGKRSAWSRAGGAAPFCYPDDVSSADIAAYRAKHGDVGVQEVRGGRRSSGGGSRSGGRASTYDPSPSELDETEDVPEPPPLTR